LKRTGSYDLQDVLDRITIMRGKGKAKDRI